ncbi:MAG: type II toxin-antitoxin system HicA family toxin, partial [Pseudonocardiaceae bacterium]
MGPLKVRDLIKRVEADGWYQVSQRGSHRQFKHPTKKGRVTIPGKLSWELYPELERSILRQAGVDRRRQVSDPHAYVILIGPTPDGHFGAWA